MDWTGGTRRRYAAGKGNPLLQKQKAHFAKARASMYHTPAPRAAPKRPSATVLQSIFDSAHTSTKSRHPHLDSGSRTAGRVSNHQPEHDAVATGNDSRHAHGLVRPYPRQKRTRSISSGMASSEVTEERPKNGGTSPARKPNVMGDEELLLLANRRRLLARPDWLRLEPTKPLRMKFPTSRDHDQIGKRRKISKTG